jgi:transposase
MRPIFVRKLTEEEHLALQKELHSSSSFTVRRCQILLSSAKGKRASQIATELHCSDQTVRDTIHAFERDGLDCLEEKSHARHDAQSAFDEAGRRRLREMIGLSPRQSGHETSVWTLALLGESCWQEKISSQPVNEDNVGAVLREMGINWRRAKKRLQSPDEHFEHRKKDETG